MRYRSLLSFLVCIVLFSGVSHAQLGIKFSYSMAGNNQANEILNNNYEGYKLYRNNWTGGIGYQHIFYGTGVSVIPGFTFTMATTDIPLGLFELTRIGFEAPVKIFPFNIDGDCDCPNFSMRNKFFEDNFFIMINSGINYNMKKHTTDTGSDFNNLNFKAGLGGGFALPLTKGLILSPSVSYNLFFGDRWDPEFLHATQEEVLKTTFGEVDFELRLHYLFGAR